MTVEISLVICSFVTLLFFITGILIGWTAREYMKNYREVPRPHPEMFDPQGNLIPCLLYTSPSPRDWMVSRMPSSA